MLFVVTFFFQICLLPIISVPVIAILCLLKITISILTYSYSTSRYDFTNADWSAINNHLFSVDWQTAFADCTDVPAQFDLWNDKLTETIWLLIPVESRYNNSGGDADKYTLSLSKNYYLTSAPLGECINFLNPLLRMFGIKLLRPATEKIYIHLNVREYWLWSTRVTPAPSIDTLILNLNLKLVWHLPLSHLVM